MWRAARDWCRVFRVWMYFLKVSPKTRAMLLARGADPRPLREVPHEHIGCPPSRSASQVSSGHDAQNDESRRGTGSD